MRFCNSICTHFLSQIKKNTGPQGGTWKYVDKIDMDPRVYNFRVVYDTTAKTKNYIDIQEYRRCSQCQILYNRSSYNRGLNRCICCNNLLTLSYYSRNRSSHRKGDMKRY